jgi:hypothetical protein
MAAKDVVWEAVRAEYEAGGDTLKTIAERHGVSRQAVSYRAKRDRWMRAKPAAEHTDRQSPDDPLARLETALRRVALGFEESLEAAVHAEPDERDRALKALDLFLKTTEKIMALRRKEDQANEALESAASGPKESQSSEELRDELERRFARLRAAIGAPGISEQS